MKELTNENFDVQINGDKITVVDFWASWCGPCRSLAPILEKLEEKYSEKADFCKVNVDEQGELARRFGVMSVPTVIAFCGGETTAKSMGIKSADALAKNLKLD